MKWTGIDDVTLVAKESDVLMHMLYAEQQRLDGYEETVVHAQKCKSMFDKKVLGSKEGKVELWKGDLVQYWFNQMDNTHSTKVKLAARWSAPARIKEWLENSYELVWRDGTRVEGRPFHARHVRGFKANPVTRRITLYAKIQAKCHHLKDPVKHVTSLPRVRYVLDTLKVHFRYLVCRNPFEGRYTMF
ncbi:hypothetical protein BDP27DRAFT_1215516 [Rhodocollybia butyracea]|uniref:Uncharacterized protein n=1 Tax=Rhodocollybia butyracea TaxID=206335 RepID=A0A9P5UB37_9AGAR|nr:hypothetical protein BDP27DRAFT_1215516 [Rhodocollybia butyracea]